MRYTLSEILHNSALLGRTLKHLYRFRNKIYRYLPVEQILNAKINKMFSKHSVEDLKLMLSDAVIQVNALEFSDEDKALVLNAAECAMNSEIEILGGKVDLNNVDWTTDYKCGYHWKNKYYTQYKTTRFGTNEDVKTVWELSRGHSLLWIAEAYQLTDEEKYAQKVVELICDWIDKNPYGRSINWTCAMEVAIRAVNWMSAVCCILNSTAVDAVFLKKLMKSLFQHGHYIYNNLENGFRFSANHYASDLAGLLWLGSLFRNTVEGRKWFGFAMPACFDEMRTQILPSGVHFERSISYHRLTCELFLYSLLAIQKREPDIKLPNDIKNRLQSMVEFVAHYTKPSGKAPLFGDSDNGRLLPFVPRDFREHSDILHIYNSHFNKSIQTIPSSCLFADAGFAILKNKAFYLMFSNTGVSRYSDVFWGLGKIGTHTHQDALSFELAFGNSDFIIDAGTACYTSSKALRDEFRSTPKHNTLSIDGKSQYAFGQGDYFSIIGKYTEPETIDYNSDGDVETVSSSFNWQLSDSEKVKHERKLFLYRDRLCVEDFVTASKAHEYEWNFILDPSVCVDNNDEESFVLTGKGGERVLLSCTGEKKIRVSVEEDTVSPSYGVIIPTKKIKCRISTDSVRVGFVFQLF